MILALFGIVLWRTWRTARLARDYYGTLVCGGVLAMFTFMIFENIGMTMGIMPVTGIPLPFMSYGGSALIACCACIAPREQRLREPLQLIPLRCPGRASTLLADVNISAGPLAEDRTAAGQGREARSLHRDGAGERHPRSTGPERVAWLLLYPDTYEIGLPNQGLQILYEILNERDDAVAERAYAPWVDLEAELRAARVAAVLGRHAPRRRTTSTSSPSTSRPSWCTRTS